MEFDNNFDGMESQGYDETMPEGDYEVGGQEGSDYQESEQQPDNSLNGYEAHFQELYRTQLDEARNQYRGYYDVVGQVAAQYGMTPEQYIEAIQQQEQEQQQEQQIEQSYNNLDPQTQELFGWVRQQKEALEMQQRAEQESKALTNELKELLDEFPDITPESIPDEVYKTKIEQGIPLVYAYARYARQLDRKSIEQQTINNLKRNQSATPGSLNNPSVDMKVDFNKMSTDEFNSLVEKVKRGQITHF